jgi:hypothetical protein
MKKQKLYFGKMNGIPIRMLKFDEKIDHGFWPTWEIQMKNKFFWKTIYLSHDWIGARDLFAQYIDDNDFWKTL